MHKLIGSSIIMVAAIFMGVKKYYEFYNRKRVLSAIRDGSIKIYNNLRCICLPLYECFLSGGEFFSSVAEKMKEGVMPAEAVKTVCARTFSLKREDREIIERFAEGLCAGDIKGQLSNMELFIKETEKQIANAQKELESRGNLFVKGSVLSAAAVILLLI